MKKFLVLLVVLILSSTIAHNYCNAKDKLKPENCAYFQMINDDDGKVHETIWASYGGSKLKWLVLMDDVATMTFLEDSRDEWSIYLKETVTGEIIQIDLYKLEVFVAEKKVGKIKNVKDHYDYDKLGGSYLN